jgi:outer membrane protein TolC
MVLLSAQLATLAQTNVAEIRKLSLEDCIQIALQHNLDVQIRRFNPELSQYTLGGSYGAYDPNFSIAGDHSYSSSPAGFDPQGRPYGGTKTDANNFNTSLSGLLPYTGLNYSLGARVTDTYGISTTVVETTNSLGQPVFVNLRGPFESVNGSVGFFELRQPLLRNLWIDNVRLQILLSKKNLKISELDVRNQVMSTITDVEQAYYNLIFAQENVRVQQKALELADRLLSENRKRVEVGALAPLDEKQAESQAAASRADLLGAQGTEDTQQRVLKNLLSDDYSQWQNVNVQPVEPLVAVPGKFDLQDSWRKGLAQRPDLLQQKLTLEKQGYIVKYQKNQLLPQLDLVGTAGYNASSRISFDDALDQIGGRDNPFWSVGGQMSIPLGNRTARYNYRGSKATQEQIALQLKQLQQTIIIQIENRIATTQTDYQRVQATREARVYAEAALEAEQKKLESGKSTSFEVLRLQRDLTAARSSEIRALADYNIDLAQLAFNEGSTLERRHVNLEVK